MLSSKLIGSKLIPLRPTYTKSRLGFCLFTPRNFSCSNASEQFDPEAVGEISDILKHGDWIARIKSSRILPQKLNPDVVQSVLHQNQTCDPQRLLQFFDWSATEMGTSQNVKSFLILSMCFSNSNQLRNATRVLCQMIETPKPLSAVLDSITSVKFNPVGFSQLIYAYKNKGMLNEAVSVLLASKSADCFPNLACLNALMSDLLKWDKMDLYWKVYQRLKANMSPDAYIYTNVINAHCRAGKIEEAKRVFSEMREKGCSPSVVTYNMLIGGLCRAGLVGEALDHLKSMTEKGLTPNEYTYTPIIDGLCRVRRFDDAKLILDKMKNAGSTPNHVTYSVLINGFMREGKIEEALNLKDEMVAQKCDRKATLRCINSLMSDLLKLNLLNWFWSTYEKMLAAKIEPNDYIYTNLIGAYVKIGKLDEAKRMFLEMGQKGYRPTLVTYNVLINGLCRAGLVDEAFELKSSMANNGLKPDTFTYSTLINGLCKLKRSRDAKMLLGVMSYVGLRPDHFTYTALIDGFLKQGEVDEAFKLRDEMVARGNKVNLVTYSCIINGLCKLGQVEEAIKILNGMKAEGVSPNVFCYNSLISSLCKAKRMDEVRGFLDQMMENGVKPDGFTYGSLISAYNSIEEIETASVYFMEMIGHGIVPDHVLLASMIDGHCKQANPQEALFMLRNLAGRSILPDQRIYNTFVQGFAKNGMMESAMEILTEMQKKGLEPDVFAYTSLISGFFKQGDVQKARQLFDEMTQKGIRQSIVTYNTMIHGLCKSGDINSARELFDEIPGKGISVNASTYATLMEEYCKSGDLSEPFRLLEEMPPRRIQPDESVYRVLVDGCCTKGDAERALLLFDRMVRSGFASTSTFKTLIDGLYKLGKLSEVNALVNDMVDSNDFKFDNASFSTLIDCYCKAGMIKDAERLMLEMEKKDAMPTIETYASILCHYIKLEEKSKIFEVLEDLVAKGTRKDKVACLVLDGLSEETDLEKSFGILDELLVKKLCDVNVFDGLLYVLCKKKKFPEALASVDEVKKRGLTLDFDVCKTLVHGLENSGYNDEAAGVLEKMVKFGWVPKSTGLNDLTGDVKEADMPNQAAL